MGLEVVCFFFQRLASVNGIQLKHGSIPCTILSGGNDACQISFVANRKSSPCNGGYEFYSRYLNDPLPYVRRNITVNKTRSL